MSEEKICGIYYIRNIINKKVYIGQSLDVYGTRKKNHFRDLKNNRHFNYLLNEDWKIFGENNFEHGIIEECSKEDLEDLEVYYIKYFKTHYTNGGYNLTFGGGSPWNTGKKATEEAKRNQSLAHMGKPSGRKGKKSSIYSINKMSESLKLFYKNNVSKNIGYKHTDETRLKMSNSRKGKSPSNKGVPASEESKRKNSESHKGKPSPRKGVILSEETKKRISDSRKGTPAYNKGIKRTEESRRKQKETLRIKRELKNKK